MIGLKRVTAWLALGTIMAAAVPTTGFAQDVNGNWTEYNGDYRSWRYSPLDKINKSNVGKLKVAWIHQPGDITSGIQVTPLVIDGVMYYIAAYNRVYAVEAATAPRSNAPVHALLTQRAALPTSWRYASTSGSRVIGI